MVKYGKVQWGETNYSENKSKFDKEKFLLLENGITTIRILMEQPLTYMSHKIKFANDTNPYGRNVRCAIDNCPVCEKYKEKEAQAKSKYIVGVYVVKTGEFKWLDFGGQIFNAIGAIKQIPNFENVMEYDINIIKNPKGGKSGFYQVVPGAPSPLTAVQIEMADNIDVDYLNGYVEPLSVEEVNNTMERIQKWIDKKMAENAALQQPPPAVVAAKKAKAKEAAVIEAAPATEEEDEDPVDEPPPIKIDDKAFAFRVIKK